MKHTNRDPERKHSFSGLCLLYNFTISDLLRPAHPISGTATVGTSFFITSYAVEWGNMAAAITLSTIPTALFIFIAQKSLVKGMTAGSVKG